MAGNGRTQFGLTLPNRAVLFGAATTADLLELAEIADRSEVFESVWVGDSLLGKPRLESTTFLGAIAARTRRVRLGVGCMASFPLRDPVQLAYQWASLDLISEGRMDLAVCTGVGRLPGHHDEARLYRIEQKDRPSRMIEGIEILKRLWTEDHVSFEGRHYQFQDITLELKPVQQPRPPIWLANNARGDLKLVDRTLRRVARWADGWQTSIVTPEEFRAGWGRIREHAIELGRDPASMTASNYHNININENRQAALEESTRFLETYYSRDFPPETVETWVALGSPEECIAHLRAHAAAGEQVITLRCTSWDQHRQVKRCIEEVLPFV